jgi:cytidylate kinase
MIIFGKVFGINGVLYAGPFADLIAFIISIILLIFEFKHLNKNSEDVNTSVIKKKSQYKGKHVVITIGREYGSGGRFIGELVASGLNINFYDKNLIEELSYETGYSKEYIEKNEQSSIDEHSNGFTTNSDELFIKESELIRNIAKNESCVIVGRCANAVLKDNKDVVNVFIYNSDEGKVDRAVKYYGLNKKTALKEIKKINRQRAKHYKTYTDMNWNDFSNYDLCINSDVLGVIDSAKLIIDFVSKKDK